MDGKYLAYGRQTSILVKPSKPIEIVQGDITILNQRYASIEQKNLSLEYKINKLENLVKDLQCQGNKELAPQEQVIEERVDRAGWYYWPQ